MSEATAGRRLRSARHPSRALRQASNSDVNNVTLKVEESKLFGPFKRPMTYATALHVIMETDKASDQSGSLVVLSMVKEAQDGDGYC